MLGPRADAGRDRHADGLRLHPGSRLVLRLGRDHGDRRPRLHGAAGAARVGTRWLVQLLTKIEVGEAERRDLDLLDDVCDKMLGKSLCALGDFAVYPVSSYLRKYRSEFEAHLGGAGCPLAGISPIEGIFAPVSQHAGHAEVAHVV
ncbi:MAG: hypothetical protein E6G20_03870 [Actinobacteria bacterium]|nr:MAG: hypothetical protein E6G20_03870 [Actinomycetota bacterium]